MLLPSTEPMAKREGGNYNNDVKRKEVRSQSDQEIVSGHRDKTAACRGFETSDFSAKSPRPDCMCQLMAEDVNQHWFWQSEGKSSSQHAAPESAATQKVSASPTVSRDDDQGFRRPEANRQEKNSRNSLHPLFHLSQCGQH